MRQGSASQGPPKIQIFETSLQVILNVQHAIGIAHIVGSLDSHLLHHHLKTLENSTYPGGLFEGDPGQIQMVFGVFKFHLA